MRCLREAKDEIGTSEGLIGDGAGLKSKLDMRLRSLSVAEVTLLKVARLSAFIRP